MDGAIGIVGAGVIGASWAALFLAAGRDVVVYDPVAGSEAFVRRYVEDAWPTLDKIGLASRGSIDALRCVSDIKDAVHDVVFVQESVPEQMALKHALYAEMEPHLAPGAIVATSASGLMLSELQTGWRDPAPLILGHPFNPPHLIPLVEVMGNARTAAGAVERAEAIYEDAGKVTIRVEREVPGHVANRLQAALWREAIHLVREGVANVKDVDKAVWAGPGLRWAAAGPTQLFHMAAGEGGIMEYCNRYGPSFERWWDDLGDVRMSDDIKAMLAQGIAEGTNSADQAQLMDERDSLISAMLGATKDIKRT